MENSFWVSRCVDEYDGCMHFVRVDGAPAVWSGLDVYSYFQKRGAIIPDHFKRFDIERLTMAPLPDEEDDL